MSSLGFNTEKFYFIGILRGIDVNKEKKDKFNKSIFKDLNMKNMIIIYSQNMIFLGQSLRGSSTSINYGENNEKNLDESKSKNIFDIINQLQNNMNKGFANVQTNIKADMDGFKKEIKADMDGFKKEIKADMDGFKKEINKINIDMSNIKKDIGELKKKVNSSNN